MEQKTRILSEYHKNEVIREKIDSLLFTNTQLEAKIGKETTDSEIFTIKESQKKLFDQIKELDIEFYNIVTNDGKNT